MSPIQKNIFFSLLGGEGLLTALKEADPAYI
jgi:hypothetical protein